MYTKIKLTELSMAFFIPDYFCRTVYDIPLSYFSEHGTKLAVLDIDNTLVTYDDEYPTERNIEWFAALRKIGADIVFVSNNHEPRVRKYAEAAGYDYYSEASKPFPRCLRDAMKKRSLLPSQCCVIGDQIFTDVLCAHSAGCGAILVEPIKDLTSVFVRFKRMCERPLLKIYISKQKKVKKRGDLK